MADSQKLNDYSTTSVPMDQRKSWVSMGLIWASSGVSLTTIVTGSTIGAGLSFQHALVAAIIGGLVLALVTGVCGVIGAKTGFSTAMISQFTFGKAAILMIAFIQAFGSFGWFGVQLGLFGDTAATAWELAFHSAVSPLTCILVGGVLMVASSVFGYKARDILSKIGVPLLLILLLASLWKVISGISTAEIWPLHGPSEPITVGYGISVAVSSLIVGALVAPDVSRYAKTPKQAAGAAALSFGIAVPIMLLIGVITCQATAEPDVVQTMLKLGWGVAAFLILLFAQWNSNGNNLYCAALGFSVVFKKLKEYQLNILSGAIGILLAMSGIYQNFTTFLNFLGILIPPMGGVIAADYYFFNGKFYEERYLERLRRVNTPACVSWIIGSVVSCLTTYTPLTLTTAPAIDGMLVGFVIHFLWMKIKLHPTVSE